MTVLHNLTLSLLLAMSPLLPASAADDGMAVVTHPSNDSSIDEQYLYRLYFGKTTTFPDGTQATPLMIGSDSELLTRFANNALGRSARQLRSFWARQIFTGRGTPPREVADVAEMKSLIANNTNFIGYLPVSLVDDSLRIVLSVD